MGNLCENFGKIARKNARLRDTSDSLVGVLNEYSGKEKINTSTKKGLVNYSSFLSAVEDYRNAMVTYNTTLYRINTRKIDPYLVMPFVCLFRLNALRKRLFSLLASIKNI